MNTSPVSDKLIEKIQKLLALAEGNNDSQAQAEAAMAKAIELATEHNIELAQVRLHGKVEEEAFEKQSVEMGNRLPITHDLVASILVKFFEVNMVTTGGRSYGRYIYFIGQKTKIEFAKFVHKYLTDTFMNLWRSYYARNPHLTVKAARQSYLLGLYQGLYGKLKAAKAAAESTLQGDVKASYGLMVVSDEQKRKDAMNGFFSKLKDSKGKDYSDIDSRVRADGYEEGQKISVGDQLNNGPKTAGNIA
jgi:hypothetical protein